MPFGGRTNAQVAVNRQWIPVPTAHGFFFQRPEDARISGERRGPWEGFLITFPLTFSSIVGVSLFFMAHNRLKRTKEMLMTGIPVCWLPEGAPYGQQTAISFLVVGLQARLLPHNQFFFNPCRNTTHVLIVLLALRCMPAGIKRTNMSCLQVKEEEGNRLPQADLLFNKASESWLICLFLWSQD